MSFPKTRLRRCRKHAFSRQWIRETKLSPSDLIQPLFLLPGEQTRQPVASMPGVERLSLDLMMEELEELMSYGIEAVALFPVIPPQLKTPLAEESYNPDGLMPTSIRAIKKAFPTLGLIADVALDPYTSHGHDGLLDKTGYVVNDETNETLVRQAMALARAGVDVVAPSDMMDGRVLLIREALEAEGYHDTQILSYAAKYASSFYGPFRDAVGSSTNLGKADKRTYQMDPANINEAIREVGMDIEEGADIVMVKPGLPYIDVLREVKQQFQMPTFAYQVSGEYAMIRAAAEKGWLSQEAAILESLLCLKRAGADAILTYFAKTAALLLQSK